MFKLMVHGLENIYNFTLKNVVYLNLWSRLFSSAQWSLPMLWFIIMGTVLLCYNNVSTQPKHMLWVLKRTVSIYVQTDGLENIYNFTLKNFVYLNLWSRLFSAQWSHPMLWFITMGTVLLCYNNVSTLEEGCWSLRVIGYIPGLE